jgi:hypothetical protein
VGFHPDWDRHAGDTEKGTGCKLVGIADYIAEEDRVNGFVIGDNVIAVT